MLRSILASLAVVAVAAPLAVTAAPDGPQPADPAIATSLERAAPPQAPAPMPAFAPAWLDLFVNDVPRSTVLVHLSGGDAWIAAEDLDRAGLHVEGGERIERGGRSLVSLASLAPGVAFTVDEAALALRVVAKQALLGRTRLDLYRLERPPGLVHRQAPSAFLNWALAGDSDQNRSASTEVGAAIGRGLLLSGATVDRTNGVVRGLTTASWDDTKRLIRLQAGDVFVPAGDPLAGAGLVLGGSVGREFSLDPYLVTVPYPRTTVFASTPATLEVWLDGTLVRRTQVLPGTIDLQNIPVNSGLTEIRTVLRDAFGREQSASTFALMGSSLLSPGLLDWGFSAGARRERFGTESFAYGAPLGQARVRRGMTRILTLGGRAEASDRMASMGGSAGFATALGELEGTVAGSVDRGEPGAAAVLAWRRPGQKGTLGAQLRWDSGHYANGSLLEDADRAVLGGTLTGSIAVAPRISLLGELAGERRRDGADAARGLARVLWTLPGGFHTAVGLSRTFQQNAPGATTLLLTVSMQAPGRTRAEVQAATGSVDGYGQLSLTRSLQQDPDVGYRIVGRGGDGAIAEANLQAQARFARAEVEHYETDPWTGRRTAYSAARLSSGLVLLDGRLFATRPVDGSYALVRVEGAPGVRVQFEGRDVGRTDRDGDLLVTGLQPYLGNRVSIRDSDLPLDFRVDEVERVLAPSNRGGTIERFRIARQRVVTGRLLLAIDGRDVPPEWGEIAVELAGRRAVSPIGTAGAFWLEGVPPGPHDALVRWEGHLCRFRLDVGEEAGTLDLGKVRCTEML